MASYWVERHEKAKNRLTDMGIAAINKQLAAYYKNVMQSVIEDFLSTYDSYLAAIEDGREPSPATLYNLDKYWQMQGNLNKELQGLGDKEAALLSKDFTKHYQAIYEASALKGDKAFRTVSKSSAFQMVSQIWCADGKTWSQRIWKNIDRLKETLNQGLVNCVVAGKKPTDLKKQLQERFGVSYRQANTLVRTEMSNIQNQAARQRYQDSGLEKYEFLGRDETDGCGHSPDCHKLDGQVFLLAEMKVGVNAPPMHPNCRCSLAPVVELDDERENIMENRNELEERRCISCGKSIKKGKGRNDSDFLCDDCKNLERKVKHSDFSYIEAVNPKTGNREKMKYNDYMELHPEKFYEVHCTICGSKMGKEESAYGSHICSKCQKKVLGASFVKKFKKYGYSDERILEAFERASYEAGYTPEPTRPIVHMSYNVYEALRDKAETAYQKKKLKKMFDNGTLELHVGICVDCHEYYYRENTKDNSLRCPECQIEWRKKQKRESARNRRAKK